MKFDSSNLEAGVLQGMWEFTGFFFLYGFVISYIQMVRIWSLILNLWVRLLQMAVWSG